MASKFPGSLLYWADYFRFARHPTRVGAKRQWSFQPLTSKCIPRAAILTNEIGAYMFQH